MAYGLGRRPQFDDRSRNFPIRALLGVARAPRSYTWRCDTWLDQGQTSACTGFSLSHELIARPVTVPGITADVAQQFYRHAQRLDEWPGEDYDGSSVLAAMKVGKERGWFVEYRWAFGEIDLRLAISYHGPALIGINWYDSMFGTAPDGLMTVGGDIAGGHAILVNGFSAKTNRYRLHNSWGTSWGLDGDAFLSVDDMTRLLNEQGEAAIPVKRSRAVVQA